MLKDYYQGVGDFLQQTSYAKARGKKPLRRTAKQFNYIDNLIWNRLELCQAKFIYCFFFWQRLYFKQNF